MEGYEPIDTRHLVLCLLRSKDCVQTPLRHFIHATELGTVFVIKPFYGLIFFTTLPASVQLDFTHWIRFISGS
jgi:hypothetical protein